MSCKIYRYARLRQFQRRGRQRDYSITLTINYLEFSYLGERGGGAGGKEKGVRGVYSILKLQTVAGTAHNGASTQYVKRDVTSPRPQLRASRGLIKRNSRSTCKR